MGVKFGLNEKCLLDMYLNTWSSVDSAVLEGYGIFKRYSFAGWSMLLARSYCGLSVSCSFCHASSTITDLPPARPQEP